MDFRWKPISRDSKREVRILLHPTASITEVRRDQFDTGSNDSVDLSDFVTNATQTAYQADITMSFNRELFGTNQPKPNQVLEIQLMQSGEWTTLWIGIVDSINQFTLQRGTRSMQLVAKTRDSQDIWRKVNRVTPLFPYMTDMSYMATRIARTAGMNGDEILLPQSSIYTQHSNTQLADMNAWDMITQIFQALGWSPFIDGLGRLKAADRTIQGRLTDVQLEDDRIIKVGGSRQRPPASRVRVKWLDPTLKKHLQMGHIFHNETITIGWWALYWSKDFYFSSDKTLTAENVNFKANPSVNSFAWKGLKWVDERFVQTGPNKGRLEFTNKNWFLMAPAVFTWIGLHALPDVTLPQQMPSVAVQVGITGTGTTIPIPISGSTLPSTTKATGRIAEGVAASAMMFAMINMGTGTYEIYGNPYKWVHARNISEAFDSSVPTWVDNGVDIELDFITNEEHAKAVAIRELIYQARAANKWTLSIVDDPRIEVGDVLGFVDGSQFYVEDFTRNLERGSEAVVDIQGFLIPAPQPQPAGEVIEVPSVPMDPTDGLPPGFIPPGETTPPGPGEPGPGEDTGIGLNSKTPVVGLPNLQGEVATYMSSHAEDLSHSCFAINGVPVPGASWAFMDGLVAHLQSVDPRVGFNGKRGGSERSQDAIAYYHQNGSPVEGSVDVYVVDVIGGHCGSNPSATWNNVTTNAVDGKWFNSH